MMLVVRLLVLAVSLGSFWGLFAPGAKLSNLTLEELDRLQRETAAAWDENKHCYGLVNHALENDVPAEALKGGKELGFCMAAPVVDWAKRWIRKTRLVERLPVTWEDFGRVAGTMQRPEAYASAAASDEKVSSCKVIRGSVQEVVWPSAATDAADARGALQAEGAVLLRQIVAEESLVMAAQRYLLAKAVKPEGAITEYVHNTKNRHHLLLDPREDPVIGRLYHRLVHVAGRVLLPLVSPLGTIVEFACYLSNPGAQQQNLHADARHEVDDEDVWADGTQAPVYSLFLFLSDVDSVDMGPLQVVPRSHILSGVRHAMSMPKRSCVDAANCGPGGICPVRAGDAALYDSTVLHRGRANGSDRTRIVVYLSVMGIGTLPEGPAFGVGNWMLEPPRRLGEELKDSEKSEL